MSTIKRPALRYHGGKFGANRSTANWIVSHLPGHRCYVEPFGGGASVLLCKPRAASEVYNDLDDDLVNFFRVLRTPYLAHELERVVRLTPYARTAFAGARDLDSPDPVERARRLVVRSFMGHSSAGLRALSSTGFRAAESQARFLAATDWANYPDHIQALTLRLSGVLIECRFWDDVVTRYDDESTLFYLDPPYHHATRTSHAHDGYRHEFTEDDHRALAAWARQAEGMIVLSHYPCPLYAELYAGWRTVDKEVRVDSGAIRRERLWFNPAARATAPTLFDVRDRAEVV